MDECVDILVARGHQFQTNSRTLRVRFSVGVRGRVGAKLGFHLGVRVRFGVN